MAKLEYTIASNADTLFNTTIYGDFAGGKTTIAASANLTDALGPVLVMDIDQGLASVAHWGDIRKVDVHTMAAFEQVLKDLSLPEEQRPELLKPVKTVIVDSMSAARDEMLVTMTAKEIAKGRTRDDKFSPEYKDYGKMSRFLLHQIHELRAQGVNIILIAGSVPIYQGDGDDAVQIGIRPNLNNALLTGINYAMSNIWYVERNPSKKTFRLLVDEKPKLGIKIKTRNTMFAQALRKLTRDEAIARGEDPDKQEGWYTIPDHKHPTLPILYDVYLKSGAKAAEQSTT